MCDANCKELCHKGVNCEEVGRVDGIVSVGVGVKGMSWQLFMLVGVDEFLYSCATLI